MRRVSRALKGRFGITAPRVAVRSEAPWYARAVYLLILFSIGYAVAYLQLVGRYPWDTAEAQAQENPQVLQTRIVQLERQLQVERAAQANLAKEMASMQDEGMRLKEDVAFYKSILAEGETPGVLKIHSVKLNRGVRPGEYQYQILLVQSGRHDKAVQGRLQLALNAIQEGSPRILQVDAGEQQKGIKVNFKYYQRIEGTFNVPQQLTAQSLQVQYVAPTGTQPALTQTINLPS